MGAHDPAGLTTLRASLPRSLYTTPPGPLPHGARRTGVVAGDDRTLRPDWLRHAARERLGAEIVDRGAPRGALPSRVETHPAR